MSKDIFRNKKDFAQAEFATEMPPMMKDRPKPRESKSQHAQVRSGHKPEGRNDLHTKMEDKQR